MSDSKDTGVEAIATVAGGIAIGACLSVWQGYAITLLWAWFAAPLFALPALTVGYAVGLATLARLVVPGGTQKDESMVAIMTRGALAPAFALLVGWIVLLCMGR